MENLYEFLPLGFRSMIFAAAAGFLFVTTFQIITLYDGVYESIANEHVLMERKMVNE